MRKLGTFLNHFVEPKILDVGTGSGNFIDIILSLSDNFVEIIGIDQLQIAVDTATKKFTDERIKFMKMDALKMEFEDNSFDLVCLSNSLHHLSEINGMLKEMERVLKPGGYLLVNEMKCDGLNAKQKAHLKIHHFAAEIDRETGATHNDTFKAIEILKTLETNSSLKIKDVWDLSHERKETNSKEELEWLCDTVDRVQKRIKDPERQAYYSKKGEKIKKYIRRVGFDSATQMVVILK